MGSGCIVQQRIDRIGSTELAERLIGFKATVPLIDGLQSVVDWRKQGEQVR